MEHGEIDGVGAEQRLDNRQIGLVAVGRDLHPRLDPGLQIGQEMSSAGGGVTFSSPTDSATSRAARLFTSLGRLLARSGMTARIPALGPCT